MDGQDGLAPAEVARLFGLPESFLTAPLPGPFTREECARAAARAERAWVAAYVERIGRELGEKISHR